MKYVLNTCKGREHFLPHIKKQLSDIVINFDNFTDTGRFNSTAWFNHQRAWKIIGEDCGVILEDDIFLCDDFKSKIKKVISEKPNELIQFFSMRSADLHIGSRYDTGSKFIMGQCYYLPKGMGKDIYEYSFEYYKTTTHKTCPSDLCVGQYLKSKKIRYWIHIPNLVDHRPCKSMLGKRSSSRQSLTFKK